MRSHLKKSSCVLLFILSSLVIFAQSVTITGVVSGANNGEKLEAVSVTIKGTATGTFTDAKGQFKLTTAQKPPFILVISSIGYETKEITVDDPSKPVRVDLPPSSTLGKEVVVSATRSA